MLTPIAFALGLVLQAQTGVVTLDDALEAIERRPTTRISASIGREAVARLTDRSRLQAHQIGGLVKVARRRRGLARALVEIVVETDLERAAEAARALVTLDQRTRQQALAIANGVRAPWSGALTTLAQQSDDPSAAAAAAELLAPTASPGEIEALVIAWSRAGATAQASGFLEHAKEFREPRAVFKILCPLDLDEPLDEALGNALATLVAKDPGAAQEAIAVAASGGWGSGGAVARSLGRVTALRDVKAASDLLLAEIPIAGEIISREDEAFVAAALRSLGELLAPEILPDLPQLMTRLNQPARIRRAAIWAFARLTYRDAPSIDLLLSLLEQQEVSAAAYRALLFKSGTKLPLRPAAWRAWRDGANLPATPPEDAETRLKRAQEARAKPRGAAAAPRKARR